MKYLFLLGLLTFVVGLVYWRLRPYIRMARRIFGTVRDVRRINVPPGRDEDLPRGRRAGGAGEWTTPAEKLVRCATCGTWLPTSRAVSLARNSTSAYCSHACLERAADTPPRQSHRSAS